ncbi:MAG: hypothetical protein U9P73_07085 [Candidatus Cloacimonadota bacterium]|nr:hypothetical protein [Candidatus Cloacimonadota bacterium]
MKAELQQILGTDKKNPVLTLYRDEKTKVIVVFFGMALLGVIPGNKDHALYKIMVGQLYNAGLKRKNLVKAFGVARTTMQRWGKAVQKEDETEMLKSLSNPGFPKKITEEVKKYIGWHFPQIYARNKKNYSCELVNNIKEVFGKQISASAIRPLIGKLKKEIISEGEEKKRAHIVELAEGKENKKGNNEKNIDGITNMKSKSLTSEEPRNRQHALCNYVSEGNYELCHHAGVLAFSTLVNRIGNSNDEKTMLIKQWILSILLGAMNIEQTKLLDFNSIEVLLGKVIRHLDTQRTRLVKMSKEEQLKNMLLKYNGELVKIDKFRDFYFDPHVKHYTGEKKILKGWCSAIRFAEKVINMDFIHTREGHPVYVEESDNFNDVRIRFKKLLENFRQKMGIDADKYLTYTVDRGLYGMELFQHFLEEGSRANFIIWEKGYKKDQWDQEEAVKECEMFRCRNNATDLLKYTFKYFERNWKKEENIRQIIVRATNPKQNTIEVSILSNDKEKDASEIIKLMFKRWLQENDFKYLDNHFGINEITSYVSKPYAEPLAASLVDVQQNSGKYKALQMNIRYDKKELKDLLLQKHLNDKKKPLRDERIQELTSNIKKTTGMLKETQKEVSRLNTVINECYFRMTTSTKELMDVVKITARNMFYEGFKPFKEMYDNYRDDHIIFRNLTRSLGGISFGEKEIDVVLYPTMNYPKKTKEIIEQLLENINTTLPCMPDGSGRILRFSLGQKANKLFTIMSWDKK